MDERRAEDAWTQLPGVACRTQPDQRMPDRLDEGVRVASMNLSVPDLKCTTW